MGKVSIPLKALSLAIIFILLLSPLGAEPAGALPAGGGLTFNGTSSYVTFGNVAGLGVTNFTLEAMVYWTGGGAATGTGAGGVTAIPIVSKGRAEADGSNLDMNYFMGITAAGNLTADFEDTATGLNHPVTATTTLLTNTWNHVAATYNVTTGAWFLYVNGVQVGTANAGAGITPRSDSIQHAGIGTAMTSTGVAAGFFAGRIDEVRIWNAVRSQAQIQASMFTEVSSGANLVARWGMNEAAGGTINSSVGTFPGTLTGSPSWHSGFPFGSAVRFDGTNDYVTFGQNLNAVNFTLEAWVYRATSGATMTTGTNGFDGNGGRPAGIYPVISKGMGQGDAPATVNMNYIMGITSTGVIGADFEDTVNGGNHPIWGNTTVAIGEWHHIAAAYDGNCWALYLDGVAQTLNGTACPNATPESTSLQHAGLATGLNTTGGTSPGFFSGIIDEARIWNVARTPAEIQSNLYGELTTGTGLLARWGLDDGATTFATTTAVDSVAPVQNGTLTNFTAPPPWVPGFPFPAPVDSTPPAAPVGLTATPYDSRVFLTWTANSEVDLAGYNIYRSTAPSVPLTSPLNGGAPFTGTTYNDTGLTNGVTYYYVITAIDTSTNQSTASNEVNATPLAGLGTGLQFDGVNDYVTFGAAPGLGVTDFTVETWFYWTGGGTTTTTSTTQGLASVYPLVSKGRGEADGSDLDMNFFLGIDSTTGALAADFEDMATGLNHPVTASTPVSTNTWHHAAATYNSVTGVWNIYLDGVLDRTLDIGNNILPRSDSIQHAGLATAMTSAGTPAGYFQGVLDEARVWSRDLTLAELQSTINSQITSGTGLVARWGMNEGTGTTAASSVGTFNGTLTNGPLWVPGAPFNLTFNTPPDAPTLVSPPDDSTNIPTSPTLSVDVSDSDGGNVTVQFFGRPVGATAGPDFSIIAIPDTQYYTSSLNGGSPAIANSQTQWIVNNLAAYNIQFATQLGDCTENGNVLTEWQNADAYFSLIENPVTTGLTFGVPYGIAPGNHDQFPIGNPAGTTVYNQFFGEARFLGRDYYGGHYGTDNDNHYELFSASGMDFIVVHLEYDTSANAAVIAWADNLLQTYSTRHAIVVTHWLINGGNPASFSAQGSAIYNALKDNPNLFLMLGGHVPSPAEGQRVDTFNGNTVYSLMSDYQGRANGGNGWLRIITISPTNNNIQVQTYSPWLDLYETDVDSQFTLPMNFTNSFQLIGTDTVPSGSTASVTWNGLNNNTEYEWYAVASDGSASTQSSTWSFTTEPPANVPPTITGQAPLATNEDTALTVNFTDLTVADPDNSYPTGFTLTVQPGANYTLLGSTITPALNYNGPLTVPVIVNDGTADSNTFNLAVTVNPVNDPPVVTNPGNQTDAEGDTVSLNIVASDVDNATLNYSATNLPTGLSINPANGSINGAVDYTAAASSPFNVTVTVSDGVGGVTSVNFTWTIDNTIPPASGLVCTDLALKPATITTGEKPQSKVWQYDGKWWAVFPTNASGASSSGTWLWELQGTTWVERLKLSNATNTKADVKVVGNVIHALLYAGTTTQLVSAEYNGASYVTWSGRAGPSALSLPNSEIATIDIDSTGRMWLATENDATGQIVAYYSDSPYNVWSAPITIATGVNNDDIADIIALPTNQIGILWSNQNTQRFGFRIHNDGAAPGTWVADEVPASASAQNVGLGMADDHLHMVVASDGTIYAAVKTSYDTAGYPKIALLVRRPAGTWDNLYNVDEAGTRATLLLDEVNGYLTIIYTSAEGNNPIVYKQSTIAPIAFGNRTTLNAGAFNDASSSKANYTSELVTIFANAANVAGAICAPVPPAGADLGITKTDSVTSVRPTDTVTYTITVRNNGPQAVNGATVQDTLPAEFSAAGWTCTGAGGGTCAASGSGSINEAVNLPVNATVTFTVNAVVSSTASGSIINTAAVALPVGMTDPLLANNSASDTDSIIATSAACENDPTLVACYPLGEGSGTRILDGTPYFNDGTNLNGAAWVPGRSGLGLDLNGTSQYVSVPDDATLDLTNQMTIALWIRPEQQATQDLVKKAVNGGTNGYEVALATNQPSSPAPSKVFVRFNQVTSGDTYRVNSVTNYPFDGATWMHVAATYDGATIKLYINGVLESSLPATFTIATNNLPLTLGAQSTNARYFMGAMDEARVYNRALTLTEILDLYGNHPPVATGDSYNASEDTALNVNAATGVLFNDNDPDVGDAITAVKDSDPLNGSLTLNPDGSFLYTPTLNTCGPDSFTYHANDGEFNSAVVNVTLNVACVNDIPTTTGIANVTVNEDAPNTTIDLWPSFADVEDADSALTYTVTGNTNAALFTSVNVTGGQNLVLDYAPDQFGSSQLTVRATDAGSPSQFVETTFTVTVSLVNDPPTTSGITNVTVAEDAPDSTIDLWLSFADVDNADNALTYTVTGNTNAALFTSVTVTGGQNLVLNYAPNANGSAQITVRATDPGALFVETTFTVTVTPVSDPPAFTSAPVTTIAEDSLYAYNVTTNDPDLGDTLTITAPTLPAWLSLTDNGNGTATLTGTPLNANVGIHNVTLRVSDGTTNVDQIFTVAVTNTNDAPSFTSTPVTSASEDTLYTYNITASDPDLGAVLTITAPTLPSWLTFTDLGNGTATLTGTPTNANVGIHNVTLNVSDGAANVNQVFSIDVGNTNDPPSFTSAPVTTGTEDTAYTYNITTSDPDIGAVLTITAPTLPAWLTLADNGDGTATLAGTPLNANVGVNNVTLRVSDGIANVDQAFTITVTNVNDPPAFTSAPVTTATEDSAYTYNVTASDPDLGDSLTITAPTLPAWLTFTDNGGGNATLTGTPTNANVGVHNVTLRVSDGTVNVDQVFTVTVSNTNDAPVFTSTAVTAATEDAPYAYNITTTDPDAGATLTITAPTLPSWLTLTDNGDGTASLTGTPTNANVGVNNVTLRVSDGLINIDQIFTITVANVNDPPSFTSAPVTAATEDSVYTYNVTASDPDLGDSLTITAPTLPAWLTLTDNGDGTATLTGTPLNAHVGNNPVVLAVNDGTVTVQQNFTIVVANTNDAPSFTSVPVTTATEGAAYAYNIATTDPDTGDTLTITAPTLPAWLTFTDNGDGTASLTGTPANAEVGSHNVTLRVNDGTVNVDQVFTINVANVNNAPSFTSAPVTAATEDTAYAYNVTASDPDVGDSLTITAPTLPAWLTLTDNGDGTASLTGTPLNAHVGVNNVTLRVSDGTASVDQVFAITVANVNDPPTGIDLSNDTVDEGLPAGTPVGNFTTTDPDTGDSFTYTFCGGADDASFQIVGDELQTAAILDADLQDTFVVCIQSEDSGGQTTQQTFGITLTNVNEPPVITLQSAAKDVDESSPLFFNNVNGALITISDPDAGGAGIRVALAVTQGTLTLNSTAGLTITPPADGSGDAGITFTGSLTDINNALNGMRYDPAPGYNGGDMLQIDVDDLGNTGSGGSQTASAGIELTVLAAPPKVLANGINTLADTGDGVLSDTEIVTVEITQFIITFDQDVSNPAGNSDADDVTNPANFMLVHDNGDDFQTTSCAEGVSRSDRAITIDSVTYSNNSGAGPFVATLNVNGGVPLGYGNYRLFICGTTSITDPFGVELAGDGVNAGTDKVWRFTVVITPGGGTGTGSDNAGKTRPEQPLTVSALPATGFAPDRVTILPEQPSELAYADLGDLWVEIPALGVKSKIVGVPMTEEGEWDVTWLGNDTGWLNGTAFPSWEGNSVLTAHVTNASGLDGPFKDLRKLKYGDQIIVHAFGQKYIFEVRSSRLTRPFSTSFAFEHLEDQSYLTLITCQFYLPKSDSYYFRRVIRAVLLSVVDE